MIGALYSIAIVAGLRRTDAILAISPQLASIYQSPGVKPGRIVVSEIGVPRAFFRPPEKVNNKSRAVSVGVYHGTVSLERGLAVIVEGAKLLAMKRRDFRIKLVGCNDSEMRLVEGLVKNADVEGLFEIIPPINHSDMPDILWSADWGISLLEPNAYFEASPPAKVFEFLAAGLPVIANDIKTHRTYLKDDYNSIIIPYEAEAFSNAMQKIIENPDLRMRLSRNALTSASLLSDSGPLTTLVRAVRILAREGRGRFDFSKMLHAEA
jgi:glycosyltransferase involved in cell wall biosynthesis